MTHTNITALSESHTAVFPAPHQMGVWNTLSGQAPFNPVCYNDRENIIEIWTA